MTLEIGVRVDLQKLIETRGLIQANSGGGKSYLLRKICEQASGKIPIIILDLEGEFATLRERYDFVLFGKEGDYPANPRHADIVARQLLELNVSAIIDLYELDPEDRKLFVRKFCDALVNAPKNLWKPTIIIIDEAHIFCPERGQAQSSSSVINLLTRGRKRGFCLHPDSEIITEYGIERIKDIKVGTKVLTHNNRFREVLATSSKKYAGKLLEISTYGNYQPTILTPNHEILAHIVKNNGSGSKVINEQKWMPAKEIGKYFIGKHLSTRLFTPHIDANEEAITQITAKYFVTERGRKTKVKRRAFREITHCLDNDLLLVIGYFLAEGNYIKRQFAIEKHLSGLNFSFGKEEDEKEMAYEVYNALKNLGYKPFVIKLKTGTWRTSVKNRSLAELFYKHFGYKQDTRTLPMNFLLLKNEQLEIIFNCYCKGDGSRYSNSEISTSSISKNLTQVIKLIGQRLGYSASTQYYKERKNQAIRGRKINSKPFYVNTFNKLSTFSKNKFVGENLACAIKEIKQIPYEGMVYDLQVEEDESFCTTSHIVHNCTILATQRLSKLHKDAAAECNNKMIGRTGLDVDMKRAGEELGLTNRTDMLTLRTLDAGEFYTFGPAISNEVIKFNVTKVKTTHPKAGMRAIAPPPPSSKIKLVLDKLKDLPEKAEEELRTIADMRAEITKLRRELSLEKNKKQADPEEVKALQLAILNLGSENEKLRKIIFNAEKNINNYTISLDNIRSSLVIPEQEKIGIIKLPFPQRKWKAEKTPAEQYRAGDNITAEIVKDLGRAQKKILAFLLLQPERKFSKQQVGVMTGYAHSSGSFNTYLSDLSSKNLIERDSGQIKVSPDYENAIRAGLEGQIDDREFRLETWLDKIGKGPRAIYEECLNNPDYIFTVEEIATRTGYKISGSFNTYLSKLSTLGLIDRESGKIKLSKELTTI